MKCVQLENALQQSHVEAFTQVAAPFLKMDRIACRADQGYFLPFDRQLALHARKVLLVPVPLAVLLVLVSTDTCSTGTLFYYAVVAVTTASAGVLP